MLELEARMDLRMDALDEKVDAMREQLGAKLDAIPTVMKQLCAACAAALHLCANTFESVAK